MKRGVFRWLSRFLGRRHSRARRGCAPDRVRTLVALGLATAAFGLGSGGAPSAMAEAVRGLVIGIDRYVELPDLQGAVNDARDVAGALRRVGADDLILLEDGAATRVRIEAEWRGMLERSHRGDTVVLAYAGHGGQEPERVRGTERDGRDEVLLLGGFRSAGPGTRERIFDDEINQWFSEAGEQGLRVVFVADSCHSGTLTRSIDPRAPALAVRNAAYTITDDMLELGTPESAALDETELEHVSLLAAGQEYEQVPEIALPGEGGRPEPRGALSYMFARALEGRADFDGDGVLRRDELWGFVRENVRMLSEARQTPNLTPSGRGAESILPVARRDGGGPAEELPALRLAILNAGAEEAEAVRGLLPGVRLVSPGASPDLLWDAEARQVVTGQGDIAAHEVGVAELAGVAGKWEAVGRIRAFSAGAGLRIRVLPDDGAHRSGARIEVEISGLGQPWLTLVGLSGNGRVHYLYPLPSDPPGVPVGIPFRLALEATPPFGADHLVAVSAAGPLDALNAGLEALDGQDAARQAAELIAAAAAGAEGWRSGIQGLYTVP